MPFAPKTATMRGKTDRHPRLIKSADMIRPLHTLCCDARFAGLWRPPAGVVASDLSSAALMPSPDCIQTILRQDTVIPAADCLADVASFYTTAHTDSQGADYPLAEVQTAD